MTAPVLQLRRAGDRFRSTAEGIESRHVFSFGPHYDPRLVGHGPLVVLNEERLLAGRGFGDHPHADAEILTWVLSGSLVHTDSRGHSGVVVPGLAQRMSAGSGIVHSERNDAFRLDPDAPAVPVRFVQMWLRPDQPGTPPGYAQQEVDREELQRGWRPVASAADRDAVSIQTAGATLWVTVLPAGVARELPVGPRAHLFVADGELDLETLGRLSAGDSVMLTGEAPLRVTGVGPAEVLLWTLPA